MSLVRIETPFFVAGVMVDSKGYIVEAAPVVGWMTKGLQWDEMLAYCNKRGWRVKLVEGEKEQQAMAKEIKDEL